MQWVVHRYHWKKFVLTADETPSSETGVFIARIHVLLDAIIANFS